MAVYVDDAQIPATVGRIKARWSHLFADTQEELHEFAASIGLKRAWFQGGPKRKRTWHYDVTESKRQQAIRAGAKPVTWRESIAIMDARDGIARPPAREGAAESAQQPEPAKETLW